ncbi:MAG TPA: hypothetical protein VLA98_00930 [Solirubrobacteraceae bacterium]|nr:hypothetical protein [Solirubrobacteraceae bacterium]
MNDTRLKDLESRIARAQYAVDSDAVAEALLRRGTVRRLLGLAILPRGSAEPVLVARQLYRPAC